MARTLFINMRGRQGRETVSEYPPGFRVLCSWRGPVRIPQSDQLQARKDLREYQISDPASAYYISTRCCANWKE